MASEDTQALATRLSGGDDPGRVRLSVVVPVYNQASSIVDSVRVIRDRVSRGLGQPIELIVVSDGSIDQTEERLLEEAEPGIRVIHYDRNLGKGYAIKVGALEARGAWIGYCDADLDLDPAALTSFLAVAEEDGLDFVIGSKRHPESIVHYPTSRRVSSWLYQQLVRLLFRLEVRDTQVGLKVFRREIADQVLPLLLVKRYAFDLELLAVARAFGFDRIRELPIRLDYRFSGSGVRSIAVLRALVDTAAIFYRLRILRYYQRRRSIAGAYGWTRDRRYVRRVCLIAADEVSTSRLDYENLEVAITQESTPEGYRRAAATTRCDVVAFLEPGAIPSGNWLTATTPFLARPEIGAVVTPAVAPFEGSLRTRTAAAVQASRLGGGSQYFRFTPGNIRFVRDFPTKNMVVRRDVFLSLPSGTRLEDACQRMSEAGNLVLYTPEAVVVVPAEPLLARHLNAVASYGRARGNAVRRLGVRALRPSTVLVLSLAPAAVLAALGFVAGGRYVSVSLGIVAAYVAAVAVASAIAMLRYRSVLVGLLAALAFPATHLAYIRAFAVGLLQRM